MNSNHSEEVNEETIERTVLERLNKCEGMVPAPINPTTRISDEDIILTVYRPPEVSVDPKKLREAISIITETLIENGYNFEFNQSDGYESFRITHKINPKYNHPLINADNSIVFSEHNNFVTPIPNTSNSDETISIFKNSKHFNNKLELSIGDVWYSEDKQRNEETYWLIVGVQGYYIIYYDLQTGKFSTMSFDSFEDTIITPYRDDEHTSYIIPKEKVTGNPQ